jgi:glycosyltransferase involved in cell wall biosynthesis
MDLTSSRASVVIPCYKVGFGILKLIKTIGREVDSIFVIDDSCPLNTGDIVENYCDDPRVKVIRHAFNQGVGAAVKSGYKEALAAGAKVIVKLDGDGQMDPLQIARLMEPILQGGAEYTKGNRFSDREIWRTMPPVRLMGNIALTYISRISSGYMHISDPNNGFTAINSEACRNLQMSKISNSYFFESDMIFNLGLQNARIVDVPLKARYLGEESSLSISKSLVEFSFKHTRNLIARILLSILGKIRSCRN